MTVGFVSGEGFLTCRLPSLCGDRDEVGESKLSVVSLNKGVNLITGPPHLYVSF